MHISCKVNDLLNVLNVLIRVMPTQAPNDIFTHVLIDAPASGGLRLSATNLGVGITLGVDGRIDESGVVATSALPLFQCLEQMVYETGKEARMTLCYDGYFLTCTGDSGALVSLESEEESRFPRFPNTGDVEFCLDLPAHEVIEAVGQVAFAAQGPYDGDQLSCVWIQVEEGGIVTLAASDQQRIAARTIEASAGHALRSNVLQVPSSSLIDLVPALPRKGAVRFQMDQSHNYLFLDADRIHAVVKLHVEWGETFNSCGDRIEYRAIPFLHFFPHCYAATLILPTAKLKSIVRRQEMQRCSLEEWDGSYAFVVQRYLKGQKKGEQVAIPVQVYGKIPTSLWLKDWNLFDVLSSPGASKELVLAVEEAVSPKLLIRWIDGGEVQQNYSYVFRARDSYLAHLEISIDLPLSDAAQVKLEGKKREKASLRENWLVKAVREAVFARIWLLAEYVGTPTEADIQRIVREPDQLGESFEHLGRYRDKRMRDHRFDWLITQTAIQSFATRGVTLKGLGLGEELHIDARDLLKV